MPARAARTSSVAVCTTIPSAQIGIIDRGYGSEIATFREEGVQTLLSGNLMDVCPVGAITTRDYRFKSRPWDNPNVVDTVCTRCSKGCSTTAWIKAKPEWAKGSRLVRITPRFNPDVNGYWMCDIGRFDYHWVEGEDRVQRPLARSASGIQEPTAWTEVTTRLRDRLGAAGQANPDGVRFLVSAHASHEELFLVRRLTEELVGPSGPDLISVTWRVTRKDQPERTTFRVPDEDAPNVAGARLFGLVPDARSGGGQLGPAVPDVSALQAAVARGDVSALYVLDPGPEGSLGDVAWILDARRRGILPLLIVQSVILTELARNADFVLPGASSVEKEASYTNDTGRLQGTARVIPPPGDALDDWQILVSVGGALGVSFGYTSAAQVRSDIARRHATTPGLAAVTSLAFARPMAATHWLQASNPSERWKWSVMFQDLPPVKGTVDPSSLPMPPGSIPLREVK